MKKVKLPENFLFYPPRPGATIPPGYLKKYEKKGWIAQRKFNGTRTLVYLLDKDIKLFTRHKTKHAQYDLTRDMRESINLLKIERPAILDGELLYSKTKNLKDVLVLWDEIGRAHV